MRFNHTFKKQRKNTARVTMTEQYSLERINSFVELASSLEDKELLHFISTINNPTVYSEEYNSQYYNTQETIILENKFSLMSSWEKGNALKELQGRWLNILRNMFRQHWQEARAKE
jgi:hypothetical protein